MNILSIDYGSKHVGIAFSQGNVAEGLTHFYTKEALINIVQLVNEYQVGLVVIGMPEGKIGDLVRRFSELLKRQIAVPVVLWEETLSTYSATVSLINSGSNRKRRRQKEHQVAAAHILQSYLEANKGI